MYRLRFGIAIPRTGFFLLVNREVDDKGSTMLVNSLEPKAIESMEMGVHIRDRHAGSMRKKAMPNLMPNLMS